MTVRPFSLYVHVPFCAQKCPYCDFNTYATLKVPEKEYVQALISELQGYSRDSRFVGRSLSTVFFGGGTPSLLSPAAIGTVIETARDVFGIESGAEITLEANPSAAGLNVLEGFKNVGVNRISFGVQSFSDPVLKALGRDHSASEARESVRRAVQAGVENVSLDIIYGVPGQSIGDVERDLDSALELPIKHISAYALSVEPGTPFFQRQERGLLKVPGDEVVAGMMDQIPVVLQRAGFERYEISNYSHPGFESRHNMVYWDGGDYLGLGAGAHSYCRRVDGDRLSAAERWSTLAAPSAYISAVAKAGAVSWRESLDIAALRFEFFYLGLRRMAGVTRRDFEARFGEAWDAHYGDALRDLQGQGFVEVVQDSARLTPEGIKLSDSVFEHLAGVVQG
jgi:oxygen-independent coproporphyrinogen-3 oxidase